MTRDEMLETLAKTTFRYIDPPSEWKDIGFTERPIWVNSEGYGYVLCDEQIESGECDGVDQDRWSIILAKIKENKLLLKDIEDTPLGEILGEWVFESLFDVQDTEDEPEAVSSFFGGSLNSHGIAPQKIWWMQEPDGGLEPNFYFDEQEYLKAYERDWCDYSWECLEDDMLDTWIERLSDDQ